MIKIKGDVFTGNDLERFMQGEDNLFDHLYEIGYEELRKARRELNEDEKCQELARIIGVVPHNDINPGYMYCFGILDKYYKIGLTANWNKRNLNFSFPDKPVVVNVFHCDNMYQCEGVLHNKFADKCTNKEWFLLDDKDVKFIKSIACYEEEMFTQK